MAPPFSEAELQAFESCFSAQDNWLTWTRAGRDWGRGKDARDIISLEVALPHLATIRLTKTDDGSFLANGVPGWGLMVCARFNDLLDTLGQVTGPSRQAG
ncbi:MAG: hypothetical protein H6907_05460 [Hyphomicrobiales bacterium]|nr:hypothetical protein [Hyphomicrobiales bacterium]MCP5371163.1 hypothetical protein [Hyphomicrobiales bacterium]